MARICLFDPYNGKFTQDMQDWWRAHGHSVEFSQYYNPDLIPDADVIWWDTADNNLLSAMKPDAALKDQWAYETKKGFWDMHDMDLTGKKLIVRAIDIEIWSGAHANEIWDLVTDVIFLAPHIQQLMMADSRPQQGNFKQHIIPCGVNLDRWTFAEREKGFNIVVVGELWESKGVFLGLQIAMKLKQIDPRYHIYWRGPNQMYHWGKAYFDDLAKDLPITWEAEHVDDLNGWLEDKNYLLSCSTKEAYGYNIAEGMSKGLRPIVHRFFGCDSIWRGDFVWRSIDEAVNMITDGNYDSHKYRQYLIDNELTLDQMMQKVEKVINA